MRAINVNVAIACATVFLFGLFFWPTPYRYDYVDILDTPSLVRTNRFTLRTWVMRRQPVWIEIGDGREEKMK